MKNIRLAASALAAAAAFGLVPATAHAAGLPKCPVGGLYSKLVQPIAVRHPNKKVDLYQPVLNTRSTTIRSASFYLMIDAKGLTPHYPPTIWWRMDKGHWHLMSFTWHSGSKYGDPTWVTGQLALGMFKAHQTHTMELSYSFSPKAHVGLYTGWAEMTPSSNCQGLGLAVVTAAYFSNK
ncbi:hypothetical protein [Streptacidiphilus sp. PAMC 29251]